jgi:fatty acid desaturase
VTTLAPRAGSLRSTEPRTARPGRAQAAHASDYTELSKRIRAAGLLERRPVWYAFRFLGLGVLLAGAFAALLLLGPTWWQLLVAVAFGVLFTQIAFLSHDAAHRQIFTNGKVGEHVSRVIGNL